MRQVVVAGPILHRATAQAVLVVHLGLVVLAQT